MKLTVKVILILILVFTSSLFAQGKNINLQGNLDQMKHFYNALNESKSKKIRVAHYGDSMIEGDLMTSDIRDILQKRFGGNGAGLVPMVSDDVQMRKTTKISFSNDWKEASLFKRNNNKLPLGINAAVYTPSDKSWSKFETTNFTKTLKSFNTLRLFYTNAANNASVKFSFNNGTSQNIQLTHGGGVKESAVKNNNTNSVKVDFDAPGTQFFGMSLENSNYGVFVDNFPVKGNSGISLVDIPSYILKDFNRLMNYKLIIISFGLNVLSPEHNDYTWYAKKMEKVVNYFKQNFPNTSIVLTTIGDKGIKRGTRFVSDPGIKMLLKAQKEVANNTGVAYWNFFEAMGGDDSINSWVNAKPPLVFKDYAHLTYEGAAKAAELFTSALLNGYK